MEPVRACPICPKCGSKRFKRIKDIAVKVQCISCQEIIEI